MRLFPSDPRTKIHQTDDGRYAFTPISRGLRAAEVIAWAAFCLTLVIGFALWVSKFMWDAIADDRLPRDGRQFAFYGVILAMVLFVAGAFYLTVKPLKELFKPRPKAILPAKTFRRHETIPVEWQFEGPDVSRIESVSVLVTCTERTTDRVGIDYDQFSDSWEFEYSTSGRVRYSEKVDEQTFDHSTDKVCGRGSFTIHRAAPLSDPKPWYRSTGTYTNWELIVAGKLRDDTTVGHAFTIKVEDGAHRPELQAKAQPSKKAVAKSAKMPSLSRRFGYPEPRVRPPRR